MYEEKKYKPVSAWGYFGYNLLFSIPVAGLVLLIIFSFSNKNINRRNFARSYFCGLAAALALVAAATALSFILGFSDKLVETAGAFFDTVTKKV